MMRPPLSLVKPPTSINEVILVTDNGSHMTLNILTPGEDFVYAGRLWGVNLDLTETAGRPVYSQVTEKLCLSLRRHANEIINQAAHWEAQLEALKTVVRQ